VVVVLVPEAGDAVQSLKAGPTEIGDVLVVNKADRPGADAMAAAVREALEIRASLDRRSSAELLELRGVSGAGASEPVPVLLTEATSGRGVDELVEVLEASAGAASVRALDRRVRAIRAHLLGLVVEGAERIADRELVADLDLEVSEVMNGRATPREAAARLLDQLLGRRGRKRRDRRGGSDG
jgi:LAO/AO transport system kinase